MSGITPILDTLLHQVLGRRVDTPVIKDQPSPVSAAASADAIQPARSDSRLHQQVGGRENNVASHGSSVGSSPVSPAATGRIDASSTQLHLSHAATEIGDILARFPSTQTPSIRPPLSLLLRSGDSPHALAAALSQSVRESGVFYESHLLRWMSGQYPRAALMREPQAWLSLTFRPVLTASSSSIPSFHGYSLAIHGPSQSVSSSMSMAPNSGVAASPDVAAGLSTKRLPASTHEVARPVGNRADEPAPSSMTRIHQLSQAPSDTLQSLVRQQLEVIVAPNLRWDGQLWPGVPMTMLLSEIPGKDARDDSLENSRSRREQGEGNGDASDWRAEVQVHLPALGVIDIIFRTRRDAALQVEIKPAEESARDSIQVGLSSFRERLSSLGIEVNLALGSRA